ncbi:uncharacterized protein LOC132272621 [Cornus florida]|uniref:uncharacterized protein LOC132272621 n=1 Tax=Cornus florida TaxID=4283 RepID=UPI0028A217CE|nr:uncharacterized protein LOC132272621 [Cornus florida]
MDQLIQQNAAFLQHLVPPVQQNLPRQDLSNPNRGNRNLEEQDNHPPQHETKAEQSQVGNRHKKVIHPSLPQSSPPHEDTTVIEKTEEISHVDLEMQDLKAKMEDVMQAMKGKGIAAINGLMQRTNLLFSPSVMKCPLPSKFRMPTIESFDGTKNPLDHLETFQVLMHLHAMPNEIMCRAFPTTPKGSAWRHRRSATHLLTVKQQKGESLRDYISRFNTEMLQVEEADDKEALAAFMGGLQTSRFLFSLLEEPPTNMAELLVRAKRHMNAEDAMMARKGKEGEDKKADKKRPALTTKDEKETKYKKPMVNQSEKASRYKNAERYTNYTPLNMLIDQVFLQIQDEPYLKWPPKLKSDSKRRPRDKYCRFHKDYRHATEDCFDLKDQIETLIRIRHMRKFIVGNDRTDINPPRAGRDNRPPDQQPMGEIRVIAGGCAGGGELSSARKAYARRMRSSYEVCEVGVQIQHRKMPRLDNGSSADIIFLDTFSKVKIGKEKLRPTRSPLVGFTGDKVYPLGAVILPITAGTSLKQVTVMVDFLVVNCPSTYNVIVGRATLNSMRAITSTYQLLMCFPTEHGVSELRGDQTIARECYVASLKEKKQQEALVVDEIEENEQDRAKLIEDLVEIYLNDTDVTKKVRIGSLFPSNFTNILIQFLR